MLDTPDDILHAFDILKAREPELAHTVLPRKYMTSPCYPNVKINALLVGGHYVARREYPSLLQPHAVQALVYEKLIVLSMPYYFLEPQFAEALAATDLPLDLQFGSIKLPLPAFNIVLPVGFAKRQCGYDLLFMSIGSTDKGDKVFDNHKVHCENDMICGIYNLITSKGPVSYTVDYPLDCKLGDVLGRAIDHNAVPAEHMHAYGKPPPPPPEDEPDGEKEKEFLSWANTFAVKVMLGITAQKTVIESGRVLRKATREKPTELWSPNIVGHGYRYKRAAESVPGTHASPRMHWRRGTWRHYEVGEGKRWKESKVVWIEPVLVNTKGGEV